MANSIQGGAPTITNEELYGRYDIYTTADEITADNVLEEVNAALGWHVRNMTAEETLFWYRRGEQPILNRKKSRNTYVNNKVVVNLSEQIVSFKNGYFLTAPASYIARNNEAQDDVVTLNEYLYRSGKHEADNEIVNWFHTVGKGVLYVEPNTDPVTATETPVYAYALDPRTAFVVYSKRPGNKPVMGVNAVESNGQLYVDVYTRTAVFRLTGTRVQSITSTRSYPVAMTVSNIERVDPNYLGEIPIIEYRYNSQNQSAFEPAISLLNALNLLTSDRCDGVEQFIQSLLVFYNADLPEGEDANSLREKGILLLKSNGDQHSEVKILSEQLNQEQTQKLVDNVTQMTLSICSMPVTQFGQTSSSDTQGAVLVRNGWYQADTAARNTEDLFRASNRQFDRIFTKILSQRRLLDLKPTDIELQFVRNEQSNILAKAQAYATLVAGGYHPMLAMAKSGASSDPAADFKMSEEWIKLKVGNPDNVTEPTKEEEITENVTAV